MLRKTLGTLEDGRPYVETLRRRGYRFNGNVKVIEEDIEENSYPHAVDNHEQSRANIQNPSARIHVVRDWTPIPGAELPLNETLPAL